MTNAWTLLEGDALPRASSFSSLSVFDRLGLDLTYDIDLKKLEKNYLELSRGLHPDFHQSKGPRELSRAVALSASLNEAYSILKDPVLRSEALVKIFGGPSAADEKRTPAGFLMEMMEYRESYEDLRATKDYNAIKKLLANLEPERVSVMSAIRAAFLSSDRDLIAVRERLNTLKYYDNLIGELQEAIEQQS